MNRDRPRMAGKVGTDTILGKTILQLAEILMLDHNLRIVWI